MFTRKTDLYLDSGRACRNRDSQPGKELVDRGSNTIESKLADDGKGVCLLFNKAEDTNRYHRFCGGMFAARHLLAKLVESWRETACSFSGIFNASLMIRGAEAEPVTRSSSGSCLSQPNAAEIRQTLRKLCGS